MQFYFGKRLIPASLLTALLLATPSLTQGAETHSTLSDFTNRLSAGYYFTNFEGFATGDQGVTNKSLSGGNPAFSFNISTVSGDGNNLFVVTGTLPSGKALSTTVESTDFLLTFTSGNVTAVGGNFFLSDVAEDRVAGPLDLTLSDGTSLTINSASNGPVGFRGFTTAATNPITSLRLHAPSNYVTFDNLYVGKATVPDLTRSSLSIRPLNPTQVEISWPLSALPDVLRSKPNLSTTNWSNVVESDVPSNGFHRVRVNTSESMRYFQLQRP